VRAKKNRPRSQVSGKELYNPCPPARSPSAHSISSIKFTEGDVDVVRVDGLKHAHEKLDARRYKSPAFAEQVLQVILSLDIPFWNSNDVTSQLTKITKVSGSLTNAVFFVSCPLVPSCPVLLLRIYGPSSGALISRPSELQTLHVLSSQYHIGPRVYGTFENGRLEEYFESSALAASELRDPKISSWIGARMAELHQVDISVVAAPECLTSTGQLKESHIAAKRNVKQWLIPAREVLALPSVPDDVRRELDLTKFEAEWKAYMRWLEEMEKREGTSRRVFAHNDTQYGNLLKLVNPVGDLAEHRRIIVVDFEYAAPNPAAFDIANHFHEWTANYHGPTPHILDPSLYPTIQQRCNFYKAYLSHSTSSVMAKLPPNSDLFDQSFEAQMTILEYQVRMWSPASHAMWAVWGIVQAREGLEGKDGEPEFDYVGYARCRMNSFRRELRAIDPSL